MLDGIKRFILWDYPRASWQYDLMVGMILAFIFLTPREWFHDQPRVPIASRMEALPGPNGSDVYWLEAELLAGVPEAERVDKARNLIRRQTGGTRVVVSNLAVMDIDSGHRVLGCSIGTRLFLRNGIHAIMLACCACAWMTSIVPRRAPTPASSMRSAPARPPASWFFRPSWRADQKPISNAPRAASR